MCLVLSTIYNPVFSCFFIPETYSRERLGVAKSHNAPKFSMHFYEHAECLIAVCFLIFPKVSSRSYTLLVFYHLKERQRSPGFELPVFRCLFPQISQKTYPFPPNISVLVLVFQFLGTSFDRSNTSF